MIPLARIEAWECITSLGESAGESSRLLRAGVCHLAPSRFVDAQGERILACEVPVVADVSDPIVRIASLASHALDGLASRLTADARRPQDTAPVLLVALAERFAADPSTSALTPAGQAVVTELRSRLPAEWHDAPVEAYPFGRAAGALALRRALTLVVSGRRVVWGGADSWHDWTLLEALARADRLLDSDNVDGLRPGEGAAFMLLGAPGATPSSAGVEVLGVGVGREPAPLGSAPPWRADGMAQALEAATLSLRRAARRCNAWWLDTVHEDYATHELQNVIARLGDVIGVESEMAMPLKELGDVGAAAMPLLAVLAAEAWRQGRAADDVAVVTGSSDGGARGALLLGGPFVPRTVLSEDWT